MPASAGMSGGCWTVAAPPAWRLAPRRLNPSLRAMPHALPNTRDYDELMGMFNSTGKFDPKALDVLARSFVEMGSLPRAPDMRTLITEQYLPGTK